MFALKTGSFVAASGKTLLWGIGRDGSSIHGREVYFPGGVILSLAASLKNQAS